MVNKKLQEVVSLKTFSNFQIQKYFDSKIYMHNLCYFVQNSQIMHSLKFNELTILTARVICKK